VFGVSHMIIPLQIAVILGLVSFDLPTDCSDVIFNALFGKT